MRTKLKEMKDNISVLSREEMMEVKNYCSLLLGQVSGGGKDASNQDYHQVLQEILYRAITAHLSQELHKDHPPYFAFSRSADKAAILRKATQSLLDFCEKNLPKFQRSEFGSIARLYVKYAHASLLTWKVQVTPMTILNLHDRWESMLENEFPGYIKSGLIHLLLKPEQH